MKAKDYWSQDTFTRELNKIFLNSSYLDNAAILSGDNDYYAFNLMGKNLTARNTMGELNLYANNCLHRLNLIDPIGRGNRDFVCGYHGWAYDLGGNVKRAPLVAGNVCGKLERLPIYNSEGALFIGQDSSSTASLFSEILKNFDFTLSSSFYESEMVHGANWKLLVENVLEAYHVSFVHANSFVPQGITSTSEVSIEYFGKSSLMNIFSKKQISNRRKFIPESVDSYLHAFIYPNMFIAITGGLVGYVGRLVPITVDQTILSWRLFESPLLAAQKDGVKKFIRDDAISFGAKLLNEDRIILEQQQSSLNSLSDEIMNLHPEHEKRVTHFHRNYIKDMEL